MASKVFMDHYAAYSGTHQKRPDIEKGNKSKINISRSNSSPKSIGPT